MKCLKSRINYQFKGHLDRKDEKGRPLIWEAAVSGDLNGTMKWWLDSSPVPDIEYRGGSVSYYAARWELRDGADLLLAGESAGKTVIPEGKDGTWDGHGVVTESGQSLDSLKGRPVYETGPVLLEPFPYSGSGIFVVC